MSVELPRIVGQRRHVLVPFDSEGKVYYADCFMHGSVFQCSAIYQLQVDTYPAWMEPKWLYIRKGSLEGRRLRSLAREVYKECFHITEVSPS